MSGILIVDDNRSIRLLLRFVSKTKFTVCRETENGTGAVESAAASAGFGFTRPFCAAVERGGSSGRLQTHRAARASTLGAGDYHDDYFNSEMSS